MQRPGTPTKNDIDHLETGQRLLVGCWLVVVLVVLILIMILIRL